MRQATLCFPVSESHILLGRKKKGFGKGFFNGFGGKVEKTETIEAAALRELHEESGLLADHSTLKKHAVIRFYFAQKPKFEVHVFLVYSWKGEIKETDEMKPQWHTHSKLPFELMWPADREWIPRVLRGERIVGDIYFNETGDAVYDIFLSEVTDVP